MRAEHLLQATDCLECLSRYMPLRLAEEVYRLLLDVTEKKKFSMIVLKTEQVKSKMEIKGYSSCIVCT